MQLMWKDRILGVSDSFIKSLESISYSYKNETKTDKTSETKISSNHELQSFPIEYDVTITAGVDPLTEYKTMKQYLGVSAPLLLNGSLFGPDYVMLEKVSLDADKISSNGIILSGKITLDFKEDAQSGKTFASNAVPYISPIKRSYYTQTEGAVEDLILKVLYNGKDITNAISVSQCVHDMYSCSMADELKLVFNDNKKLWDGWSPKKEELIEVNYGLAKTGKMFIDSVIPQNGLYTMRAMSIPPTSSTINNKSWENVKFTQIVKEIANRHNLGFKSYGVTDYLYSYVKQENEPDFQFLQRRCELEGCSFIVYDKNLVLYSQDYLENQDSSATLTLAEDTDYNYVDNSLKGYGSMTVQNGNIQGNYKSSNGLSRVGNTVIQTYISGTDEANRFAKGILRKENNKLSYGTIKDDLMREYSAGSVIDLVTDGTKSWNGKIFIDHVRNDYVSSHSKLFFRKV